MAKKKKSDIEPLLESQRGEQETTVVSVAEQKAEKKEKPESEAKKVPEDLLKRDEFINQLYNVADSYSKQNKTACYAINGAWGVGKTYVLDKFEQKLKEQGKEEGEFRFLVLRYNCWEYDYYDEPLLSMAATILDGLEEYQLKEKTKATIKGILTVAGNLLINAAISYVDEKTNGAASKLAEAIDAAEDVKNEVIKKVEAYNDKLPFQKAIKLMRDQISLLSAGEDGHTVIILVDELDRCLPEYAIRVLERLHHLFEGIENVQLIFAVDQGQLEHVVKQLYGGDKVDTAAYLRKFIGFELTLTQGYLDAALDDKFDARFHSYVSLFAPCPEDQKQFLANFKAKILIDLDIRRRIALVEKAELVHRLTWKGDEPPAYFTLCIELMLTMLQAAPYHELRASNSFSWDNYRYLEDLKNHIPCFSWFYVYIQEEVAKGKDYILNISQGVPSFDLTELPGIMLAVLHLVLGGKFHMDDDSSLLSDTAQYFDYIIAYWNQLTGMK